MPCRDCEPGRTPAKPTRFVLEATWSGYRAEQRKVVHREVIKPYSAEGFKKLTGLRFTDATTLDVVVRPCTFREKVEEKFGYKELLWAAYYQHKEGFVSVDEVKI